MATSSSERNSAHLPWFLWFLWFLWRKFRAEHYWLRPLSTAGVFFRKLRECREKQRFRKAVISAPPVREPPLFLLHRSGAPRAPRGSWPHPLIAKKAAPGWGRLCGSALPQARTIIGGDLPADLTAGKAAVEILVAAAAAPLLG